MPSLLPRIAPKRGGITLLLAVPVCLGAYYAGSMMPGRTPATQQVAPSETVADCGGLVIDPTALAVGELWETPGHTVTLPVTNRSGRAVTVKDFSTSCDCTAVEPRAFTLGPGESRTLAVKLDLTHRQPYQVGMEKRELAVDFAPVFADAPAPANRWKLTGVIRSRVTLAADLLHFEDMLAADGEAVTRKVRATVLQPGGVLELVVSPPAAGTAVAMPVPDAPNQFDLALTPDPKLPEGKFRFRVEIALRLPDGTRHPCTWISCDGDMQPPARVVPALVLLGEHPVGGTATAEILVRLPKGSGWTVGQVEADAADTTITPGTSEGEQRRYRLTQAVTAKGPQTRKVHFVVRGPDGATTRSTATVSFDGIAGQ